MISRLIFTAQVSPSFRIDAYKAAIQEIMKCTGNIDLYQRTMRKLNEELEERKLPVVDLDMQWISETSQTLAEKTERLESELTNYKNNLIKESIRVRR